MAGSRPTCSSTGCAEGIALNTFFVGLIKAPFMALVIGVIACIEGMAVQGSAGSLGCAGGDLFVCGEGDFHGDR